MRQQQQQQRQQFDLVLSPPSFLILHPSAVDVNPIIPPLHLGHPLDRQC